MSSSLSPTLLWNQTRLPHPGWASAQTFVSLSLLSWEVGALWGGLGPGADTT